MRMLSRPSNISAVAAFVVLLMVFAFAEWKASSVPHQNNRGDQKQSENWNSDASKTAVQVAANPKDAEREYKNDWYEVFKPTDWLLVFFTGLLAIYTRQLYKATGDLRRSTDKLWEAGERQSERELRAFVFAKAVGITPNTITKAYTGTQGTYEVPVSWVVTVIWENAGSTPTRRLFTHVNTDFFDEEMPENFTFPDLGDQTRVPTLIGPHAAVLSGGFEYKVSDPNVAAVSAGKKHLYVWGWAEYDDIFQGTPRHRTEFCYELFLIGAFPVKAQLVHRVHRLHNAADEECRYPLKTPRLA
jgi:hypothetical protein